MIWIYTITGYPLTVHILAYPASTKNPQSWTLLENWNNKYSGIEKQIGTLLPIENYTLIPMMKTIRDETRSTLWDYGNS